MPSKKTKKGKQRKDSFYQRAKVAGYRARSAYKLIQLNTKYKFLQNSKVCIDLCAAPGSWTQVAAKFMPVSSVILAVDLFPIRPIPNTITIQGDITTDAVQQELKNNLKTWKADLILHDGSPNVGSNWLQDAYDQNVLVLHSFRLACQFLRKGGTFLTKVFRSKDHYSLEFVFRKLFAKVEATKPIASRHSSAEIYMICQGFHAPDKIDPNFFDPKHVFVTLESEPVNKINVLKPVNKKQRPEGYEEGVSMLFKSFNISEFLFNPQYLEILESANEFKWDLPQAKANVHTTEEIVQLFKDIKVLNRKDLRILLNWRKLVKAELETLKEEEKEIKNKIEEKPSLEDNEAHEIDNDMKEIETVQQQVEELKALKGREEKQRTKKIEKRKRKIAEKNSLRLMVPGDPGPQETDRTGLFRLDILKNNANLNTVVDQTVDMALGSDDEEDDENLKKRKKVAFSKKGIYNEATGVYDKPMVDEFEGECNRQSSSSDDDSDDERTTLKIPEKKKTVRFTDDTIDNEELLEDDNPLLEDLVENVPYTRDELRAEKWFDKPGFDNMEKDEIEDYELDNAIADLKTKGVRLLSKPQKAKSAATQPPPKTQKSDSNTEITKPVIGPTNFVVNDAPSKEKTDSGLDTGSDSDSSSDEETNEREIKKKKAKRPKLDEVGLALATKMIHSEKSKREIYDQSWNRYMYGDEDLPDWFEEDEKKYNSPRIEVDKEDLKMVRESIKPANARTLKKVVEAKARKQRRVKKAMARTKKKAEVVTNNADMTQREKAVELKKIYRKATNSVKKKEKKYIVMKKHFGGKRPKGVKGPSKMVDKRLKKDKRALKKKQQKSKGRKKK